MKSPNFSLEQFKANLAGMIQTNERYTNGYSRQHVAPSRDYSDEEIERIINSGSLVDQRKLSLNYFNKDGYYKRILIYYATLLQNKGILIPHCATGQSLSNKNIQKRYYSALEYVSDIPLAQIFTDMTLEALISGTYYGVIHSLSKKEFSLVDLPSVYCASRYRDFAGNDLVEFNVTYFDTILDLNERKEVLKSYPDEIIKHYNKYIKGKVNTPWVRLPAEKGICFKLAKDGRPMFLSVIKRTIQYDQAVDDEQDRIREEISKIIIQKMPHLSDGTLVFETPEAQAIHEGTVGMMKNQKHVSVLTTYADVEVATSKSSSDGAVESLTKISNNIYADAGVSCNVFSPTNTQSVSTSIQNDIAYMMILGNKYARFITQTLNELFGNSNISFSYIILPISIYNQSDYITDALKLAQAGYSFILPAVAIGLDQRNIVDMKDLENDLLDLSSKFIPLASSYQTSSTSSEEAGRPTKAVEEKAERTIDNEDSMGG